MIQHQRKQAAVINPNPDNRAQQLLLVPWTGKLPFQEQSQQETHVIDDLE